MIKEYLEGKEPLTEETKEALKKEYSQKTLVQICRENNVAYSSAIHQRLNILRLAKNKSSQNKSQPNAGAKLGNKMCACGVKTTSYIVKCGKRVCLDCPFFNSKSDC